MILSLCACGGEKNSTTNSPEEQTETENKTNAEAITLNSTIDLDNVTITLEAFEVSTGYSFKSTDTSSGISITRNASIDCPSDIKLIYHLQFRKSKASRAEYGILCKFRIFRKADGLYILLQVFHRLPIFQ